MTSFESYAVSLPLSHTVYGSRIFGLTQNKPSRRYGLTSVRDLAAQASGSPRPSW